ncbi:hypothetical protein D9M68_504690 [compost metagenome]
MADQTQVKVYHGYGHTHNLVIYGHVFKYRAAAQQLFSKHFLINLLHLIRLFIIKPYPFVRVQLHFGEQTFQQTTAYDGFFKFEWESITGIKAGWHSVKVEALSDMGNVSAEGYGQVYVPHITQYIFISDIDDTILVSHSATWLKRLRELVLRNPRTRKTFPLAGQHYALLAQAHTNKGQPNPFFYVSSSEWNLYDYLVDIFRHQQLPEGIFLLNQLKRWNDLWRTGKTGHEGKLLRIARIMEAFPNQQFVLFGDNSQQDPEIYELLSEKYVSRIRAVYIRQVRSDRLLQNRDWLRRLNERGVAACLYTHSREAIIHSKKISLIEG